MVGSGFRVVIFHNFPQAEWFQGFGSGALTYGGFGGGFPARFPHKCCTRTEGIGLRASGR